MLRFFTILLLLPFLPFVPLSGQDADEVALSVKPTEAAPPAADASPAVPSGDPEALPPVGEPAPPAADAGKELEVPTGGNRELPMLTLAEAVDLAFSNNLGLRIGRFEPAIAERDVDAAEAEFDPRLRSSGGYNTDVSPIASSTLDGADQPMSNRRDLTVGGSKRLPTGTEVDLSTSVNRYDTNSRFSTISPDYSSALTLRVTQPLLQGAGKAVNLANIARAQSALRENLLQVRMSALDLLAEVELAYWDVAAAYSQLRYRRSSLEAALELLSETRERERLGLVTGVDVLQARSLVANQEANILLAENTVLDTEDGLLSLVWKLEGEPTAEPSFGVLPLQVDIEEAPDFNLVWQRAMEQDLDLDIQEERLSQLRLDKRVARNNLRPRLDLSVQGSVLGRENDGYSAYENAVGRDGHAWGVGVEFSVPWGRKAEHARYQQSILRLNRERVRERNIEQSLLRQVRVQWRELVTSQQLLESDMLALELNERSYEQERVKYENGITSFRLLLEAQRDLDIARQNVINASLRVIQARVRMTRLDGTLLQRHGFYWEEIGETLLSEPREEDQTLFPDTVLRNPSFAPPKKSAPNIFDAEPDSPENP